MRWMLAAASLAWLTWAGPALADDFPPDVFQRDQALRRSPTSDIDRLTTDMRLGRRNGEARVVRWLERNPDASVEARRDGWLALCAARFREHRFDDGIVACEQGEALQSGSAASVIALMQVLRQAPPTRWSVRGVVLPLREGHITVSHGGASIEAMVDSGAEVAFVSETMARRLGGRRLSGSAIIGTTTTPVAGEMVTFDALDAGGVQLLNVPAVVLPDEQMAYAEESLVLDLATLISMRRAAFLDHGARLALGDAAPRLGRRQTPLYWDESGVGFAVDFAGGRRGVHFDTGSRRTYLFPAALGALSPAEAATREAATRTIGGLGGERVENASKLRGVTFTIAGQAWRHDEIQMAEADENGEAARVGTGLLQRFGTVVLDFGRMRMSVAD